MKISTLLIASALLAGSAGLSLAQDQAPPAGGAMAGGGGMRQACAADMAKFCPDKTGPDRRACMQSNQAQLSDGCKSAMAARAAAGGGAAP